MTAKDTTAAALITLMITGCAATSDDEIQDFQKKAAGLGGDVALVTMQSQRSGGVYGGGTRTYTTVVVYQCGDSQYWSNWCDQLRARRAVQGAARDALKEAISAVESVVKRFEGVPGGGFDHALDALGRRITIHRTLRDGLVKLYDFTSDSDGIRHLILDEPTIGEEDARFFIVTCSAAVNWVIAKAQAAELLKPKPR